MIVKTTGLMVLAAAMAAWGQPVPRAPLFVGVGGQMDDGALDVIAAPSGHVLVCGWVSGIVDADPGPGQTNIGGPGASQATILRYDRAGPLMRASSGGGTGEDAFTAVALDGIGNLFLGGYFENEGVFGRTGQERITSRGKRDGMIAKYGENAMLVWVRAIASREDDEVRSIATDRAGNVYAAGIVGGAMEGAGPGRGGKDGVLVKFDSNGTLGWARVIGGAGDESCDAVSVLPDGGIVVGGTFAGEIEIGGRRLSSRGERDVFIARLTPGGDVIGEVSIGGPEDDEIGAGGLAVDANGAIFVAGSFRGEMAAGDERISSRGGTDAFVAVLGQGLVVQNVRGIGGAADDGASRVRVGADGSIHVCGWYRGEAEFGGAGASVVMASRTPAPGSDAFIVKYGPEGGVAWVRGVGGGENRDAMSPFPENGRASGLYVAMNGRVYAAGQFYQEGALYGPGLKAEGVKASSAGAGDWFMIRLEADGEP